MVTSSQKASAARLWPRPPTFVSESTTPCRRLFEVDVEVVIVDDAAGLAKQGVKFGIVNFICRAPSPGPSALIAQ